MATAFLGIVRQLRSTEWNSLLPKGVTWSGIGFALRTMAASLVALYVAFLIDLDDPKWAPMTVWIVAQSSRGMSLSKSQYRILGTVVGAAVAVSLTSLFAQTPALFVPALGAWLGLCTGIATGLRNFRSYAAVLAGYTAIIIVFDSLDAPQNVLDTAVARVIYIVLGIVTEAVFTAIFAPGSPLSEVQARLAAYLRQTSELCAQALRGVAGAVAFQRLFLEALNLDAAAEYAAAGSSSVRSRLGYLRGATSAALTQMAAAQALREHFFTYPSDVKDTLIVDAAVLFDKAAYASKADLAEICVLRSRIAAALSEAGKKGEVSISRLFTLDRLDALLAALHDAKMRENLFVDEKAPSSRLKFTFHVDHAAALHNGIRAFIGLVAGSLFWIATGWPSGPGFVVILSVVCALLATRPDPIAGSVGFLKGAVAAVFASALCNFAILPLISDFDALAIVLGIFMVGTGLALRNARLAAPAASFAFLFLDLVSPENISRVDAAAFLNAALALVSGVAAGVVLFTLLFPPNLSRRRKRLQKAVRRDLADIGTAPGRWSKEQWLSKTADRLGRHAATSRCVTKQEAEADLRGMLAALTIGDAAISLQGLTKHYAHLRKPLAAVLRRLASGETARLANVSGMAANHLAHEIGCISAPHHRTLIRAVVLLQEVAEAACGYRD